jgi:possible TPR repeat-containing protein
MGVPVVTLAGESLGSRFGASLVENVGAGALIARTLEEYVDRAVSLANDVDLLDALHAGLRQMMENSPVMNAAGYGTAVGAAYEQVWAVYEHERSCR